MNLHFVIKNSFFNANASFFHISSILLSYSVSNQTLTGYGDISPDHLLVEFIAIAQMFIGVFFMVIAIAQALPK